MEVSYFCVFERPRPIHSQFEWLNSLSHFAIVVLGLALSVTAKSKGAQLEPPILNGLDPIQHNVSYASTDSHSSIVTRQVVSQSSYIVVCAQFTHVVTNLPTDSGDIVIVNPTVGRDVCLS